MSDLLPTSTASTPVDPAGECADCHGLLGAYSLKALDRVDQGLVEQHLRWCADCRGELAMFEAVTDGLAFQSADVAPPSAATWSAIRGRLSTPEDSPRQSFVGSGDEVSSVPPVSRFQGWFPISAIAPLVLAVILLSAWSWSLQRDLSATQDELSNHTLLNSTLATSQQVRLYSMEQSCPTCDGVGQVGVSESNGMGMVVGWDFDPEMTHDVWGIDHEGERSRVCSLIIAQDGAVMQMFSFPDVPSRFTDLVITDQSGKLVYQSHISPADDGIAPAKSPTS